MDYYFSYTSQKNATYNDNHGNNHNDDNDERNALKNNYTNAILIHPEKK